MATTMKGAYATSGQIFKQVTMRTQPNLMGQLEGIEKGELVVVRGQHDHVEKLLDTLHLPYTMIEPDQIPSHQGGRVMIVNCARYAPAPKKEEALRMFVEEGGRLVTTDWAVELVSRAFPGTLKKTQSTNDDVVEIQCANDLGRKLVGLNYAQCHPKWWLEGSSEVYSVGKNVTPIITSTEMKRKYGQDCIVAAFPHGQGEVFNFISHLELQRTHLRSKADEGSLDDFLKNIGAERTDDMEDAKVGELEAAFSTLNTLAYLCARAPLINMEMPGALAVIDPGKSIIKGGDKGARTKSLLEE